MKDDAGVAQAQPESSALPAPTPVSILARPIPVVAKGVIVKLG